MADLIQEQATTYTPGENDLIYNTVVTMGSYSSPQPVVIKQYDSLPIIAAKMRKDGNDYQVPDGAAVNIRLHKRSGTFIYSSVKGISQDRKMAYIQLTSNMTAVYGRTMPCLEIVVNGSVACTGDMVWDIQRNPVQEDDVKDTSEGQYIQEMAAQVQAFEDTYREALDYMNNATNQSRINNAASNAQAAQQAATNAANSADEAEEEANRAATESAKALGFRSFHGGQVVPGATDGDLDPSRPMSTPTAASVTIKARGDRIAGLTMAGKTTQVGTGDPSPENIRPISGVGMYDRMVVFDGSEDEGWMQAPQQRSAFRITSTFFMDKRFDVYSIPATKMNSMPYGGLDWGAISDGEFGVSQDTSRSYIFLKDSRFSNVADFKSYLSQHPLILWYKSVDYAKSTGPFYTVVQLSDDPYRAVGFELNQLLFDGDELQVNVPSGCDKRIVLGKATVFSRDINGVFTLGGIETGAGDGKQLCSHYVWAGSNPSAEPRFDVQRSTLLIRDGAYSTAEEFNAHIEAVEASGDPVVVWYRSAVYTPENDIPVALESHAMGYKVLDGTERFSREGDSTNRIHLGIANWNAAAPQGIGTKGFLSSQLKPGNTAKTEGAMQIAGSEFYMWLAGYGSDKSVSDIKSYLSSQYSAGTPVQVVYELATPVVFAHEAQTLIAEPGADGTFTVTGENSLSVLLKPFQDGGDAARLEGHTWDDIMAAIDEKIASLASTVMEVN